MSTVILLATLGALVVASGCSYTPVRTHPDFASAARKVQKVAVLSPDVEYTLLVLTGDDERLPEEERKGPAEHWSVPCRHCWRSAATSRAS
ncbi:MAG: hypothetical protein MZV65_54225 [Chromatiales bacterium]|nr:hypothetical protein [Chromatiales bacterium]